MLLFIVVAIGTSARCRPDAMNEIFRKVDTHLHGMYYGAIYNFQSFFWRDVTVYLIYGESQVHCRYNNNLKQVMLTNNLIRVVVGGPLSGKTFLSHFTLSSFFQL
jgi:hypothetical protein